MKLTIANTPSLNYVVRLVERQFPFIEKVDLNERDTSYYHKPFLELYISLNDLSDYVARQFDVEPKISSFAFRKKEQNQPIMYLNSIFLNVDDDNLEYIQEMIENVVTEVGNLDVEKPRGYFDFSEPHIEYYFVD